MVDKSGIYKISCGDCSSAKLADALWNAFANTVFCLQTGHGVNKISSWLLQVALKIDEWIGSKNWKLSSRYFITCSTIYKNYIRKSFCTIFLQLFIRLAAVSVTTCRKSTLSLIRWTYSFSTWWWPPMHNQNRSCSHESLLYQTSLEYKIIFSQSLTTCSIFDLILIFLKTSFNYIIQFYFIIFFTVDSMKIHIR